MPRPHPAPNERGLSESVSWALLVPVIMLCVLGLIQGAIWANGRTVATNAALAGAEAQSLFGAGSSDGEWTARDVAVKGGLNNVVVDVAVAAGLVTVSVNGNVESFFGPDVLSVNGRASRPIEGS